MSNNYSPFPEVSEFDWNAAPEWCTALLLQLAHRNHLLEVKVKAFEGRDKDREERIKELQDQIKELQGRLAKDSHNSSSPPSKDRARDRKNRSLRKPSGKKPGGQSGHKGHTLNLVDNPTQTIRLVPKTCEHCGGSLAGTKQENVERRQTFDVPERVSMEVTEYQAPEVKCPGCGFINKAAFPEGIVQPTQYGKRIKALIAYLLCCQFLPLRRTAELMLILFGCHISEGTLLAARKECSQTVSGTVEEIRQAIKREPVIGVDETGMYVGTDGEWLHVYVTALLTFYAHHKNRGMEAMDSIGILPKFLGIAVHDCWKSYLHYTCEHAWCNVHLLRELQFLIEETHQEWAKKMSDLLHSIKKAVDDAKSRHESALEEWVLTEFLERYVDILKEGFDANPPNQRTPRKGRGGPIKQSTSFNLLVRLRDRIILVLRFMNDLRVPFGNNQAEQDIRMMKLAMKIFGTFRTIAGADEFCLIRSYTSTARKQGYHVIDALRAALNGDALHLAPQG